MLVAFLIWWLKPRVAVQTPYYEDMADDKNVLLPDVWVFSDWEGITISSQSPSQIK